MIEGEKDASILLLGWGSTYGSLKAAMLQLHVEGTAVAMLQLRHLNPLPQDLGAILRRYSIILVAELNSGQLCKILRSEYLIDAQSIQQCNGLPFSTTRLVQQVKEKIHEQASLQA